MTKRKNLKCTKYVCEEAPYLGGLCKAHHDERRVGEKEREEALETLRTFSVQGERPTKEGLFEELKKANHWLEKAYFAIRCNKNDEILKDETQVAPEWCITISKAIINEEIAYRGGKEPDLTLSHLKKLSWKRFSNLEAGLMSNGVKRPVQYD